MSSSLIRAVIAGGAFCLASSGFAQAPPRQIMMRPGIAIAQSGGDWSKASSIPCPYTDIGISVLMQPVTPIEGGGWNGQLSQINVYFDPSTAPRIENGRLICFYRTREGAPFPLSRVVGPQHCRPKADKSGFECVS
jgi:hypothetical protein